MKITEVRINIYENGACKGFASITIDDEFVVQNFKILEGRKGLFVGFPSQQGRDDKWYETAFPLNHDTRDYISNSILTAYQDKIQDK